MSNGNTPAYPFMMVLNRHADGSPMHTKAAPGLTKREHFAAIAMQGICAKPNEWGSNIQTLAAAAVDVADALIEALERDRSGDFKG